MGIGDDAKTLAELTVRRSSVKGQVTKFKNYLDKVSKDTFTSTLRAELSLKLSKFEVLSLKFDDLQSQIETYNPNNLQAELQLREDIESEFVSYIVIAQNMLHLHDKDESSQDSNNATFTVQNQEMGFKLPLIQISKFDGSPFKWLEFRDTFRSLIHDNTKINSVNKFHYLISYLEGEPARTISNLEISSSNYQDAWSILLKRYDNKRLLINHHLGALFNIQTINKESDRSLRFLVDHVAKNLRALSNLGQATEHWDVIIIHLVASKRDNNTFIKWEEHRNTLTRETPTLEDFNKFLNDRAAVLESLYRSKMDTSSRPPNCNQRYQTINKPERSQTKSFAVTNNSDQPTNSSATYLCPCCNCNHRIYDCPSFKARSISDRISEASKLNLCLNCLRSGHSVRQCRCGPCRECKKRHNTMLHLPNNINASVGESPAGAPNPTDTLVNYNNQPVNQALLATALVEVVNPNTGKSETVRALIDCGSQSSFISAGLKQRLSLPICPINPLKIVGFGNKDSGSSTETCIALLKSKNTTFSVVSNYYVIAQLTGKLPNAQIDTSSFMIPDQITLADPSFNQPSDIDMLLGSDIFWDIIGNEQKSLGPGYPKLHSSRLGWLIGGPLPYNNKNINNKINCNHSVGIPIHNENIECQLNKFWELEEIPSKSFLTNSEQECESHFVKHTHRLNSGRFCVKLPLMDTPDCLGDSYAMAKKRFYNLEKRFKRQPEVKAQYINFMREYAELGHLSEVSSNTLIPNSCYYLPHHPVFKEDSESTKIRVVFDASARSSSGLSINDIQIIGPQIQDSLFSILVRARLHKYLLTADVEKMYRQIVVDESDRNLQLILWREDERQPIKTLRLNTVTYGFASASFLSTRCLWQLGEECDDPAIKTIIQHDLYIDDLITGCNSEDELMLIQKATSEALSAGCLNLRKYKSNSPSVLESCATNSTDTLIISESASALGLGWDPEPDLLSYCCNLETCSDIITKRYILATSFKIFDPLGFISPSIIIPKLIMQQLWLDKVGWDDPLPDEVQKIWRKYFNSLTHLSCVKIPKRVLCDSPIVTELHSFSDASQKAYGACIYIRSIDKNGKVHVNLLCSKSKVAPLKACTIARLELCAAVLAARLCKSVVDSLRFPISQKYHWCDSSVVLAWLRTSSRKLKTFVANRVAEIMDTTEHISSWRYVPTTDNPADLISRGVYLHDLKDSSLWWSGPTYLQENEPSWPTLSHGDDDIPEIKTNLINVENSSKIDFQKFSKLNRLKRVYAYVLRFIYNSRKPEVKLLEGLTLPELQGSFKLLCRTAQQELFPAEYILLSKNKPISPRSNIIPLTPFMDSDCLIRVGGRLDASTLSYDRKHPILLHSSHHLTKLVFEREHVQNLHAGPQLLLASVRANVWPINGRHLARRTVHNCLQCRKVQGKTLSPIMGNLPSQRITVDHPFRSVGTDFAGPFFILNKKGRGSRVIKCYLCIFICLRFKCVHLEAVSDLSKDSFILTLRRFISRRGKPAEIFCDNGRNFVAAAKDIYNFITTNKRAINDFSNEEQIKFSFSPSYAPNFGGIWEAGVKSAKFHIKRVMGNAHLTFEEITTLFAQVEAILNSRPICPMSPNPNDFSFLTPGHFLLGRPLTSLPSSSFTDCKSSQLSRYERLEQVRQHFWRRWQREYLGELQQRSKWRTNKALLNVGDLVLLHEENQPPLCWRMGRINKLFPGPDGVSRVADVQTTRGVFRRPLTRICPLPATAEQVES